MSKITALKYMNAILAALFLNQWVGSIVYRKISYAAFKWGHERAGILLVIMATVHLVMNWNWVKTTYFKKKK